MADTWREAELRAQGELLTYAMIGAAFSAKVICRHETEISRVGYVQFVLDGSATAHYRNGSSLHMRFSKMPVVDSYESIVPWYAFEIEEAAGSQATFRMSDRPRATLSIFNPLRPSALKKRDSSPDLDSADRSVRFLTMLVYFDPERDAFLLLRAHEWSTRLRLERKEKPDTPAAPVYRLTSRGADRPSIVSAERLRDLSSKLSFESPGSLLATEFWYARGGAAREIKLPPSASQKLLQAR
jgi:hypothetical protein